MKPVDMGALQTALEQAHKNAVAASGRYNVAQAGADKAKEARNKTAASLQAAREALANATRTVLG